MAERKKTSISLSELSEEAQKKWHENVARNMEEWMEVLEATKIRKYRAEAFANAVYEGRATVHYRG